MQSFLVNVKIRSKLIDILIVHWQSCGYAVPYYEFRGHRQTLLDYFESRERADQKAESARGDKGLKAYWDDNNMRSIDGIPGLRVASTAPGVPTCTNVMKRAGASLDGSDTTAANGSAVSIGVKTGRPGDRRRVEEVVFAFALGVAVAAVYVRFVGAA